MLVEEWCYNSCFSASGHRANLFTLSYTCELTSNCQPGKGLVVFVVMTFPLVCSGDSAEAVWPDPLHWLTWKSAASENEGSEASTQSWTTFTTKEGNSQQKIPTVLTRSSSILTLTMRFCFVFYPRHLNSSEVSPQDLQLHLSSFPGAVLTNYLDWKHLQFRCFACKDRNTYNNRYMAPDSDV